jgi:hypothetical protein
LRGRESEVSRTTGYELRHSSKFLILPRKQICHISLATYVAHPERNGRQSLIPAANPA